MKSIILTILDGWGYSENKKGNAIQIADTPTIDKLWNSYPNTLLNASGRDVGLPEGQMGNSEVGHTTIGAGRIINQDLVRISKSIEDRSFFNNEAINSICQKINFYNTKLHLIGLCSNGGVHSHIKHLFALLDIAMRYKIQICIHAITDGRDTSPYGSKIFIEEINNQIQQFNHINICTISGRYYSMDRDCRWARTEKSYNTLLKNTLGFTKDPILMINEYYKKNISDEFIPPTRLHKGSIENNDGIIFFNFRPDRMRQLVHAFTKSTFKGFNTTSFHNLEILTLTQYDPSLDIEVAFPAKKNKNFIGEIIAKYGLKQLRLAETEKYAHVTYFFNGGIEEPFAGEDRQLIPSPKVETYDLDPEMSATKLTESAINAINKNTYKFIVINYANPDMVGHTGNLDATIHAIQKIDKCIKKIWLACQAMNSTLIITSDHGNADYMLDENNEPCTSHSTNPVPFILAEPTNIHTYHLRKNGNLADIAPTILQLLNLNIPNEMNGISLLETKAKNKI
uniref:2,3-bisphosphoglycerate-independent phosphoglycerate mutase n=1 Tax=Gracilaria tenuistipitata var. liui TaxID=285951 RepID=GPMI_GRATL|nr:phosphoglycerate mutase [Gracilaria tenuistipitata var. liui]Q6B8L5.1 RecName: Full=2,3-bisphosphoglycerate-independent phosphoglycerate mutase; Short=BPG-independent PGAM; Short=Phosphoglyceromutase; Short=iPGM [Gracilaria tenuistipitata var. liui]AAT79770.1 phosphoglycerate mutase [Gracilaria tenuistipitata var. liui]